MGWVEINLNRINDICILFNIIIFLFIPLFLVIIRSIICRNVPKWDLFLAYNAVIVYAQLVFYLWLWIKWSTWTRDPDMDLTLGFEMFIIPSLTNGLVLLAACTACFLHSNGCWRGCSRSCSGVETHDIYPFPEERTPESVRYLLNMIKKTGPTLVNGMCEKTGSRQVGDTTIYFYDCTSWSQFRYTSWKNVSITGEDVMEKLLNKDKMFVLRINVEIKPENEETSEKYEDWHGMEPSCGSCFKTSGSRYHRYGCFESDVVFLEEVVTSPDLGGQHAPVNTLATLQLPAHAKAERHAWPKSADRILVNKSGLMEWGESCCYCFFEFLCLGPVYRLFFWLTVKTVTVNIVKSFNTVDHQQYSDTGVNAYKNNLEGFVIKKFAGGNQPVQERNALITNEFKMMGSQAQRQREFDV